LTWYERCEDVYPDEANFGMGEIYYFGGHGVEEDKTKAAQCYSKVADGCGLNNPRAMAFMAEFYIDGEGGVEVDNGKAFLCATKSAEARDKYGEFQLARCNQFGIGVRKNYSTALLLYESSKDDDNDLGVIFKHMGEIYRDGGHGVEQELTKAVDCFRKASDLGTLDEPGSA